ncbi:uncharacterized protein PpBr36_06121 [Pyricularia pennisetigena]|uniref:uncharacterized protein n=1 Tax=Pyricularia pennisetigena TaxID=1578925 RepID=UPI001154C1D5|nr:uncharacterized protein PpBr36_06121 [Pyricularia pennisetigena]TLS23775.1 hypothetical protein PpBr36_06121 [Pyricularia pennisetigena]
MKPTYVLIALIGVATALNTRQTSSRPRRPASRPAQISDNFRTQAPRIPLGAPAGFTTKVVQPTRERPRAGLTRLPDEFIDGRLRLRRDRHAAGQAALAALERRQEVKALDFYECENVNPAPASRDCNIIIDQVYATAQDLLLTRNSCVVFDYQTCRGFFCSLCGSIRASADFIGNQLLTADALCVSQARAGTVVGTDPPQWDAGFVRAGASLPTYSVCT